MSRAEGIYPAAVLKYYMYARLLKQGQINEETLDEFLREGQSGNPEGTHAQAARILSDFLRAGVITKLEIVQHAHRADHVSEKTGDLSAAYQGPDAMDDLHPQAHSSGSKKVVGCLVSGTLIVFFGIGLYTLMLLLTGRLP